MPNEANVRQDSTVMSQVPVHPQWQKLEELAARDDFETILQKDLPRAAAVLTRSGMDRRTFLKIMGASIALSGLGGCTAKAPDEPIIPYVEVPENIVLGRPLYFATTTTLGGFATGVLLETHEGRPARVEGNPNHPASLGGGDPYLLASVLELYNPDRSVFVLENTELRGWEDFQAALAPVLADAQGNGGAGMRILTETVTSPTLAAQLSNLLATYPSAKWYQYEPISQDNVVAGAQLAFGDVVNTVYKLENAKVILSLDADFLATMPGSLAYARAFADGRRIRGEDAEMNRLYVVESSFSTTGASADSRLAMHASQIESFARALAAAVGVDVGAVTISSDISTAWFNTLVADLQSHAGNCVVIAGPQQPASVHALAHAINGALNAAGNTVVYTPSVMANPVVQSAQLAELVQEMNSGAVSSLFILGGNPVFTAPADIAFADALARVPFSVHLSLYIDETTSATTWHVPQTHYIEEWSDARAYDGTASLVQPPIGPLYETVRSIHEMVATLTGDSRTGYEILREYWQGQVGENFDSFWNKALQSGVIEGTAFESIQPTLSGGLSDSLPPAQQAGSGLEIVFRPDYTLWDGRFAANSWLLELPDPITKICWDNVAQVSVATAAELGVQSEDLVELVIGNRSVIAPVWVMPGQPDGSIAVTLGFGRTAGSEVSQNVGFNPYVIRTAANPWFAQGLEVRPVGQQYTIATTQSHYPMQSVEHPPVRTATLIEFQEDPHFIHEDELKGMFPKWEYGGYAWGMAIDLTTCIGCSACVLACQTENNIPTVGKEQVEIGREMYWLRIDRYFEGNDSNPKVYFQPVPCMHCENAPCELVCPVAATVHSDEGLNQMVYNRCIGTRYCSNNCPYKVRRFNFLNYIEEAPILQELRNPDVTVRSRGVMEKCTYCVQRISHAHIESKKENRPIYDGEIVPACASACPTKAIVFGDINDVTTEVAQWKSLPHNYGLLAELNTRPRTTYLARLYNSNNALDQSGAEG